VKNGPELIKERGEDELILNPDLNEEIIEKILVFIGG
jgi:hypothetical protein